MKKLLFIALIVLFNDTANAQYDLNQMIYDGMLLYEGKIDLFPTESSYTLKTSGCDVDIIGKTHFKNDSCNYGFYGDMYRYLLLPTAKNIELVFKEAKSIVDFYKYKTYADCDFYQPAMNYCNNEEVNRIIDGNTVMAYLNLSRTINYERLAELGKDKSIYFTVEWVLVPNRLMLRVFMNDEGFAGLVLFDKYGFKAI